MTPLQLPTRDEKTFWYLGTDNYLAQGDQGNDDLGDPIEFIALTAEYAPAGIGGEAIFTQLQLSIFRDNDADMTLEVTPIVDGVEQTTIELSLPAVSAPARAVHELGLRVAWPSESAPRVYSDMRGTWFQVELRTLASPESLLVYDGRVVIEGVELEWEAVREARGGS